MQTCVALHLFCEPNRKVKHGKRKNYLLYFGWKIKLDFVPRCLNIVCVLFQRKEASHMICKGFIDLDFTHPL